MNNSTTKITKYRDAIIIFCLLFILYPNVSLLNYIPLLPFLLIKTIISLSLILIFLKDSIKNKEIDCFVLTSIIFYIYAFVVTKINNGDLLTAIFENLIFGLGLILFVKIYIDRDKNLFIKVSLIYFLILHIINFIFIFINKNTSSIGWFFDNRNNAFRYTMPLIYFLALEMEEKRKKINENIYSYQKVDIIENNYEKEDGKTYNILKNNLYSVISIIILISILFISIYSGALTTSICFLILIPYIIFLSYKEIKFLNIYVYLGIIIVTFILFTIPPINKEITSKIIILLGKSESANGRFLIYDQIISAIQKGNIVFGNGIPKLYEYLNEVNIEKVKVVLAHSLYLDIFYKFGIIGTLIFISIIIVTVKEIVKSKNIFIKNIVSIFIFIILLWSVADEIYIYRLLYYFAFLYYIVLKEKYIKILNQHLMNVVENNKY